MKEPLVTIITPAYNCVDYILTTLESVLMQDYGELEYIIIDDGSKDLTPVLLKSFGSLIINIRYNNNVGEQKTVNEGLTMVTGKYFMIVNADDPLLPDAVSKLVEFMEQNPDILCAYPDWESINDDGSHRAFIKSRDYDFEYMVKHHTCLPSVGSMFRSSILKVIRRDESYRWLGDFDFWLKVGFLGPMAHFPETLATWRHRDGQASGDKSDARAKEHIRIMQDFYSWPDIPTEIIKVKREATCWSYLVASAVTDSKLKMIYYIARAFITHPLIIFGIEFWDALIKRVNHILRR